MRLIYEMNRSVLKRYFAVMTQCTADFIFSYSALLNLNMKQNQIIRIDIGLGVAMSVVELEHYFESQSVEPLTAIDKEGIRQMFKSSLIKMVEDN